MYLTPSTQAMSSARAVVRDGLTDVQNSVMSSTSIFSADLQRQTQKFSAKSNEGQVK